MIRRLVGKSDNRVAAVALVARSSRLNQTDIASHLGITSPATKELLESLEADGFIAIDKSGPRPAYYASEQGEKLAVGLERLISGGMAADLIGRVLVCVTRARGRSNNEVREALVQSARSVFTGFGSFQYAAVCDDDAELVAALQGRVEELGAEATAFRVSALVERTATVPKGETRR